MELTPRQVIQEVLKDYSYALKCGMNVGQALEILKSQLVDLIEYERQVSYDMGLDAGYYSREIELAQPMYIGTDQQQDTNHQRKQRQEFSINAQAEQADSSDDQEIDAE